MFFTVSTPVKELCAYLVDHPEDWIQAEYSYICRSNSDIRLWTANGTSFIKLNGNDCFSITEKFAINKAIKRSIVNRLKLNVSKISG